MFEFGRELRRLFGADDANAHREGLTGGDPSLLELLDMRLLQQEAKSADVAAGRVSAKDPAQRRLEAAIVWREVARRSGDVVALRKSAAAAERAADLFGKDKRPEGWARARCEQAHSVMLGADLFGDEGLNAAASVAFRDARARSHNGLVRALSEIGSLCAEGRLRLSDADLETAQDIDQRFERPMSGLKALTRRGREARLLIVEARMSRADLLLSWGMRLGDVELLSRALTEIDAAIEEIEADHEPVSWARLTTLRGQALTFLGEMAGSVERVVEGVNALTQALPTFTRADSPLDWARMQAALAQALQALGEATTSERAYEQAVTCFDRASLVLKANPALALGAMVASNRALCLARSAELSGDLAVLDAAEAAFRIELTRLAAQREPTAWALLQVNLARLYESRIEITGRDHGERVAASVALNAALDVFSEQGLRSMSVVASDALERLSAMGQVGARPQG